MVGSEDSTHPTAPRINSEALMRQWLSSLKRWLVSRPVGLSSRVTASARRALKPTLEMLEERVLPSGAPAFLTASRAWIVYSPSAYNPYYPITYATDAQITTDLQTLANEGWKGIITTSLLGTFADIPRIASAAIEQAARRFDFGRQRRLRHPGRR
jgi:hypothetical protein